ncbi:hypothetical protein [Dyella ginsengisoli]|uniref:hypothetical protein n=1 Tax=Dyella ginsengisoli TaxID=363848 RepID=UPI000366D167|nr:hypothetical protein [Dyella ginsengisoli]
MNQWKWCVVGVLVLASGGVAAQKLSQAQAADQLMGLASQRAAFSRGMTFGVRYNEHWETGMVTLADARKSLFEDWQKLGLSAAQAKVVADAYVGDTDGMVTHPPLEGRNDEQISAMIRRALSANRYRDANQLLIDYERKRLRMEPVSAKAPSH